MNSAFTYTGLELEMFRKAHHWKRYTASAIKDYVHGSVAEVGAGTGNFTTFLQTPRVNSWTYIEPDERFRKVLLEKMAQQQLPPGNMMESTSNINPSVFFDTIIYMDVIEHILDDKDEIRHIVKHLNPGGHIILMTPAFQFLYSRFDKQIGHYRRYSRRQLMNLFDVKENIVFCKYFDSAGFFSSLANRFFLKQEYPTSKQVQFWDSLLVPISTFTDRFFSHSFGKSLIIVWENNKESS